MSKDLADKVQQSVHALQLALADYHNAQLIKPEPKPRRTWSERSETSLLGVHPRLAELADKVLNASPLDIMIIEGLRTRARQAELVKNGASRTRRSYHIIGRAIDFVPLIDGEVTWHWPHFKRVGPVWEREAEAMGIKITWGGRWKNFPDGPHVQLEPYQE